MDGDAAPRGYPPQFQDRRQAGRQLAALLLAYRAEQPLALPLPRGGVPVAYEVARALDAPLDVFPVRKLGVPGHQELAMGAIAAGGVYYLDQSLVATLGVTAAQIERVVAEEWRELERRQRTFRDDRPFPDLHGRTVILVDDGLATGSTARAAVRALRGYGPRQIVLAAPVCAAEPAEGLRAEADTVVCALTPPEFFAVGWWYEEFDPTSDQEVVELLRRAARAKPPD